LLEALRKTLREETIIKERMKHDDAVV
jgi:hypothetical protein